MLLPRNASGGRFESEGAAGAVGAADGKISKPAMTARLKQANVYYRRACVLGSGRGCAFAAAAIADKVVAGTARETLELDVKACGLGVGVSCRQGAELIHTQTPECIELAATLDVEALTAELLRRGCKLGDVDSCELGKRAP